MKVVAENILTQMDPRHTRSDAVDRLSIYVEAGLTVQMQSTGLGSMFGVFEEGGVYVVTRPDAPSVEYENARSALSFMLSRWDSEQP